MDNPRLGFPFTTVGTINGMLSWQANLFNLELYFIHEILQQNISIHTNTDRLNS